MQVSLRMGELSREIIDGEVHCTLEGALVLAETNGLNEVEIG